MTIQPFSRTWLYHEDYPDGKIFETEEDAKKAYNSGAVEAPWLVGQEEDILDNENSKRISDLAATSLPMNSPEYTNLCQCGCGTPVRLRFAPGHYSRKRTIKNGNSSDSKSTDSGGSL